MFEKGLLAGKRILVTGGGSGLGAAMGRRFVELGAELIICGRRLELLEATAAQMRRDPGGKVTAIRCDIRDGAAVEAMMDAIWREAPLDVLVNNAAATFIAQTEHLSFRAADAILAPTLHGAMYCTLAAGKRWIEGGHKGVVLSILSTSTITGRALHGAFGDGEVGRSGDDQKPRGGVGTEGHSHRWRLRPARFRPPGASGQLRPEGRDQGLGIEKSARPCRRTQRACRSCKFPDFGSAPATSMARWWCRMAARICAVPAPRICCNGPTRSGRSSARRGQKAEDGACRNRRFGEFAMSLFGRP